MRDARELRSSLDKFGFPAEKIDRRLSQMDSAFPEAMVEGYHGLLELMKNHPKDRHVLAAAIKCGANCIVSANKKHFPQEVLEPFEIECLTPGEFLQHQYHLNPDLFIGVLKQQAADIKWTLPQLLSKHVPVLATLIVTKG